MKPCPNCGEECISGRATLAELIPLGPNFETPSGEMSIVKEYKATGVYYHHANGKICVKDCAKVVDLDSPTFRTLREPVHK